MTAMSCLSTNPDPKRFEASTDQKIFVKSVREVIVNAFSYMKTIEKWGTGISKLFRECRVVYGLPNPEILDDDGDVRANIQRKAICTDGKKDTDRKTDTNTDRKRKSFWQFGMVFLSFLCDLL